MTQKNKMNFVSVWDPEYNPRSKTLKVTLVLDEEGIHLLQSAQGSATDSPEVLALAVAELLERSIHLNIRPPLRRGPWRRSH